MSCAIAAFHSTFPTLVRNPNICASRPPRRRRIQCSASQLSSGGQMSFSDFPYVSAPQKELMVDLFSSVETRLGSFLHPCNLPADVQSYQNQTDTAHAALLLRSGIHSSQVDLILGSWLHCELPSGGALNITSLSAYLNSSTDAPNLVVELIQSSPTSMVLVLDLPPRKDIVLDPDYLKTFYEDTKLEQHRQHLEKLPEVTPYFSSSLYFRSVISPTAILVRIETESLEEMIKTHVSPIAKEVLNIWLDVCAFGNRVVSESEIDYLKKRDKMSKSKTIEIDLESNLPRLFGRETADRVLQAIRQVF
uniref:red chlorophyll catabolite reductase, chloroplastic n=1 Tax=Erigeron canadensis TaxID=72917 RepID=UPI001CB8B26C|nr:red chlorophyll catabolite reductase, chloroplastic [Erigeron canadensis]